MSPHTPFDAVRDGAVLLGGVLLFIAPFTARGRVAPHWMRIALWLSCPIALAWSFLGFTLAFGSLRLSQHTYYAISHTKAVLTGMGLGILILLFASGEFIGAFSRPKTPPEPK